jgi:hypothetical protein
MNEIEQQVWNQFTDQLKIPVWNQIKNQVSVKIRDQVYNQNKMREIIINRFQRQVRTQVEIQVNNFLNKKRKK